MSEMTPTMPIVLPPPMPMGGMASQTPQPRMSVTTSMMSMWDGNQNGVQLRISGMDTGISLGFWIPSIGADGRRTYPREQRISAILTQKNCAALEKALNKYLIPAYTAGNDARYGVYTNNARTNMIEVETKLGDFYLNYYQGCDVNTHIPQRSITFKFETVDVNESYNPATGEYITRTVQADFYLFMKMLSGYNELAAGSIAGHGNRVTGHYSQQQLMDYLRAIATSVHAQLPIQPFQRGFNPPPYNPENPAAPVPSTPMTEVDDLSDLYN